MGLEYLPDISEAVWQKEMDFLDTFRDDPLALKEVDLALALAWLKDNREGLYRYVEAMTETLIEAVPEQVREGYRFYFEMAAIRLLTVIGDALAEGT